MCLLDGGKVGGSIRSLPDASVLGLEIMSEPFQAVTLFMSKKKEEIMGST